MIKSQLKHLILGVVLFSNLTSELNAGFKDGCQTHTYIDSFIYCPKSCVKSITIQGQCDDWGMYCSETPGSGHIDRYRGVCVNTKGLGWKCENLVLFSTGAFKCKC
jgi:hypothetical protein